MRYGIIIPMSVTVSGFLLLQTTGPTL